MTTTSDYTGPIGPRSDSRPVAVLVAGTRPEAIKVAPLALALAAAGRIRPHIVASGQHPTLVAQSLAAFGLRPDTSLSLDRGTGRLSDLVTALVPGLDTVLDELAPAVVVVQGDTTTALMAAQVAFWRRIPVVHLEAGLRSFDLDSPFPEEANRKLIAQISALHLAPTAAAAANLQAEGLGGPLVLTIGNTVVDAVLDVADRANPWSDDRIEDVADRALSGERRLLLVTAHRRESWGEPLARILRAVVAIVDAHPDVEVVLPAHPNPEVTALVAAALGDHDRVTVTGSLPYPDLVRLLAVATLVLSDSGGIQEEAPTFGVPVLVLREVTERVEAVDSGCALLVGADPALIIEHATRLLADEDARRAMTAFGNPFGDGAAGRRAEQAIAWLLGLDAERPTPFAARRRTQDRAQHLPSAGIAQDLGVSA